MKVITILVVSAVMFNYVAVSDANPTVRAYLQNLQNLAEIEVIADKLRNVLVNNGVKFSPDKVEWAMTVDEAGLTNDINNNVPSSSVLRKTRIIFLEEGSSRAGLQHIVARHAKDFQAKDGKSTAAQISEYLYNVMSQGKFIVHTSRDKKGGVHLVYTIASNNYLHVSVGSNGFIVTAFPSSKSTK